VPGGVEEVMRALRHAGGMGASRGIGRLLGPVGVGCEETSRDVWCCGRCVGVMVG